MSSRNLWPLVLVISLLGGAAQAVTVHVATTGSDAAAGSADQPVASVKKALELVWEATEPAEIIIHEGAYPGDVTVGNRDDMLGGPRPPLLITAAPKAEGGFEEVIFEGGKSITEAEPVEGSPGLFRMPGKLSYFYRSHIWESDTRTRYTLVADLEAVRQFPASFWFDESEIYLHTSDGQPPSAHQMGMSQRRNGINVWRPNTTVRGLQFRDFLAWRWSCGVEIRGPDSAAEDCVVRNSVRGYQIMMEPPGVRVVRCRTEDVAGAVYSQGRRAVIEDCVFVRLRDGFMVPAYPQDDCGIQFYYPAREGEVRRNLVVGFFDGIFVKCPTSQFIVENNTCVDGIQYGIGCTSWHPDTVFRNNIAVGFSWPILMPEGISATNEVDYNCFWGSGESGGLRRSLEDPRKVGTGTHTIYADPRFAAPIAGDYRLLPDSPCATLGAGGTVCGAFGTVGGDFRDVQPPEVCLSAAAPAKPAGGSGELYFEQDPWLGGGQNLVRTLGGGEAAAEWITPQREVTVQIEAQDAVSRPAQMSTRIGEGEWSAPAPFDTPLPVTLPEGARMSSVGVRVADQAGNWSEPQYLLLRTALTGPQLRGAPVIYASNGGAVISFETDAPCLAKVEFGPDATYGSSFEQPREVQRTWVSADGGDWVEIRSRPRVTNYLVLLPPLVEPGRSYHYRLVLQDEVGNQTSTADASFAVQGPAHTWFVSPGGRDADGLGSREQPWRTIQFAADRALPGDRVLLLPGLYAGESYISHGGLEGAPITIEADRPGTAVLDGRWDSRTCLRLHQAPQVVIRGLEVRWFEVAGIYLTDSPDVTVQGCKIWNNFWMGWPIGSGIFARYSPGLTADQNLMFEFEQGITLLQSPRARITRNTITRNMYGAVKYIYSAAGSVARNNCFAFSGNDQYLIITTTPDDLKTFDSDYNNLGTYIRAEAPSRPPAEEDFKPAADDFFRNSQSKAVAALNGERYYSLGEWRAATGQEAHSIFAHPQFTDPEHWDFTLRPDSPNIGAGEEGVTIGAMGVGGTAENGG